MGLFSKRKDEINYEEINKALDLSKTVAAIEEKVAKERRDYEVKLYLDEDLKKREERIKTGRRKRRVDMGRRV